MTHSNKNKEVQHLIFTQACTTRALK